LLSLSLYPLSSTLGETYHLLVRAVARSRY
jgi:hypothetical protein